MAWTEPTKPAGRNVEFLTIGLPAPYSIDSTLGGQTRTGKPLGREVIN